MRLIRGEDGRLVQTGVADHQPIPIKKQLTMKGVSSRRKQLTTPAERKLCFALQALVWYMGGTQIVRYQRERTVHIADMLSRSLDFYFSHGKIGIEADGRSHSGELQSAKDAWTDELIHANDGILVLRFSNETILNSIHRVVGTIAIHLRDRQSWPARIRDQFDSLIRQTETPESWYSTTSQFIVARKQA